MKYRLSILAAALLVLIALTPTFAQQQPTGTEGQRDRRDPNAGSQSQRAIQEPEGADKFQSQRSIQEPEGADKFQPQPRKGTEGPDIRSRENAGFQSQQPRQEPEGADKFQSQRPIREPEGADKFQPQPRKGTEGPDIQKNQ